MVAHRADDCLQVSAKDVTNVDPAFGHVALAAFEHFKEIKALQEQELMKGAASARIDLGAADDQPAGQESTTFPIRARRAFPSPFPPLRMSSLKNQRG